MSKPRWLNRFLTECAAPLLARKCAGCGQWCLEQRDRRQWDKWDAGIIQGDDLTVAIICERRLTLLDHTVHGIMLRTVCGLHCFRPDGQYLAEHWCRPYTPVSTTAYESRRTRHKPNPLPILDGLEPASGYDDPWAFTLTQTLF